MFYVKNGFLGTMEIIEGVFYECESEYVVKALDQNEEYQCNYQMRSWPAIML